MIITPQTHTYSDAPVGSVIAFAGEIRRKDSSKAFETNLNLFNWLECNGESVRISEYPELYATLGTRFGETDPSSFCLPNFTGMPLVGNGSDKLTNNAVTNSVTSSVSWLIKARL